MGYTRAPMHCSRVATLGAVRPFILALATMLVAAALIAAGQPARAQSGDLFTVTGVEVDVSAESAAAARDQAMIEAPRTAYRRLMERLTPSSEHNRIPDLSDSDIDRLIQEFEVEEERTSDVRYVARLTFRFREQDVRQRLMQSQMRFVEMDGQPVLMLPALQGDRRVVLFDGSNPWLDAWYDFEPEMGIVPVIVPDGGIEDVQDIDGDEAARGDEERIEAIGSRYDVDEVVVAVASGGDGDGGDLQVIVSRYGMGGLIETFALNVSADDGAYQAAVADVGRELESRWRDENVVDPGTSSTILVRVPVDGLNDWVAIRDRLEGISAITRTDVRSMARGEVAVQLDFLGDEDALRSALSRQRLSLSESTGSGPDAGSAGPAPVEDVGGPMQMQPLTTEDAVSGEYVLRLQDG